MNSKRSTSITKNKAMKSFALLALVAVAGISIRCWCYAPVVYGEWSLQTLYVSLLDAWHGSSTDEKAYALWIDDDSAEGVYHVRRIADAIGIKPCFAVVADGMTVQVSDSLSAWQRQGRADIVLHGLRHERWNGWSDAQITLDIRQSRERLHQQGFDTASIMHIIAPPHGSNTRTIRKVISQHGCQMITGASLVNPDRHVFQLGRIAITPHADTTAMRRLLERAFCRRAFVIFATHSSIPGSFSEEKNLQVLTMAKEIGFNFHLNE